MFPGTRADDSELIAVVLLRTGFGDRADDFRGHETKTHL